jgi:amino-acid N-acetyltransferase
MLPGAAVSHSNFSNIIHDIALLNHLGVRVVLVHGARQQIEQALEARNIETQIHHGKRITDPETLACFIEAVGSTRFAIESALSTGLPN